MGVCDKPELPGYLFAREGTNAYFLLKELIWAFSTQREISLGRHKDSCFESQEKGGCVEEAEPCGCWPKTCLPSREFWNAGGILECCCAAASPARAPWYPGYSSFLHTATFSLMEICSLQVSEVFFTSCDLSGDYLGVFCLESRLPSLQVYLGQSSSQQKPRVSILKQNAITHSVGGYLDFHINAENYIWMCTSQAYEMLMVK